MKEPIAKLHDSENSMFFDHVERPGNARPVCTDGGLPKRAGEEMQTRHDQKGRFCAPKSFAIGSKHYRLSEIPSSVYRLQFNGNFTFRSAIDILPYLESLGIEGIYCSPIFASASSHGYDVIDSNRLNPQLGTIEDFGEFCQTLNAKGMKLILDVIPNHMGIKGKNLWWWDVLENGPNSPYSEYFDINWNPLRSSIKNKILLPLLGEPYGFVLENQGISLFWEDGFYIRYGDFQLPIAPRSYSYILEHYSGTLELPIRLEKKQLADLCKSSEPVCKAIEELLALFNGKKGDAKSFDLLHELLEQQYYRLSHWLIAGQEINYRRFFNINELAAICIENEKVLNSHHHLVFELLAEKKVQGLRIDHPDGLYDPAEYFERVQKQDPPFVVVEKILGFAEPLPESWQVEGTVGYDFLDVLNGVFIQMKNEKAFNRIYKNFIGHDLDFRELLYEKKKRFIPLNLASEIYYLSSQLEQLTEKSRYYRDFTRMDIMRALQEIISCFPVYRTYIKPKEEVKKQDREYVSQAIEMAKQKSPEIAPIIYQFIQGLLFHEIEYQGEEQEIAANFLLRFQQLQAPAMAKGLEDSTFYVYNRLISLNEVGGNPIAFGNTKASFHKFNTGKKAKWPLGFLASSTHDTKYSEDARMRLHVLSEIPEKWKQIVKTWKNHNKKYKTLLQGEYFPHLNREYYIYQMLLALWQNTEGEATTPQFLDRIWQCLSKILREADTYTSWRSPSEPFEKAVKDFLYAILTPSPENSFYPSFLNFQKEIDRFGKWNSLSSTILKLGSCGIVDIYQGCESWKFSGVDPDNRRLVDYDELQKLGASEGKENLKFFITSKALQLRKAHKELFLFGEYVPLQPGKEKADHVVAFLRQLDGKGVVIAAGRFFTDLVTETGQSPIGACWGTAELLLPKDVKIKTFTDVLTDKTRDAEIREGKAVLPLAKIFEDLPVAMLAYG